MAAGPFDPVAAAPPAGVKWPARTPVVTFASGGLNLLGVLHVPAGPGPHPVVVFLPGFPVMSATLIWRRCCGGPGPLRHASPHPVAQILGLVQDLLLLGSASSRTGTGLA